MLSSMTVRWRVLWGNLYRCYIIPICHDVWECLCHAQRCPALGYHALHADMCPWWGGAVTLSTHIRARRLIIMLGLMLWVLWSPVANAFGGCVGMGAMCDGPPQV